MPNSVRFGNTGVQWPEFVQPKNKDAKFSQEKVKNQVQSLAAATMVYDCAAVLWITASIFPPWYIPNLAKFQISCSIYTLIAPSIIFSTNYYRLISVLECDRI